MAKRRDFIKYSTPLAAGAAAGCFEWVGPAQNTQKTIEIVEISIYNEYFGEIDVAIELYYENRDKWAETVTLPPGTRENKSTADIPSTWQNESITDIRIKTSEDDSWTKVSSEFIVNQDCGKCVFIIDSNATPQIFSTGAEC